MRRYDVEVHTGPGQRRDVRLRIEADNPGEAVVWARERMRPHTAGEVYAVYRHRRVRGRKLVGYFAGPGDDGAAGVREPRRPLPDPGTLRAERGLRD
jgi:hypothetical protein